MVYVVTPDPLLTCPLDESHRILKSRMQFHLVRCLKNHKLGMRLKCPWNPLHIIDKFAYEDHYTRQCEDMPGVLDSICPPDESRDVGSVPVTATNEVLPPVDEDWDAEPGNVGTYDPSKVAAEKPVLRIAVGLSKAKRKQWRAAERKRFQTLEENGPIQIKPRANEDPEVPKTLRQPHKAGKALSTDTSMIDDLNSSKASVDNKKIGKDNEDPQKLRNPHKPSPAVSYNPLETENLSRRTSFSSNDGSRVIDELPNLCQSLFGTSIHDTTSRRSSICSHENIDVVRRVLEQNLRIKPVKKSMHCSSEAETPILLDEAACLPNLVASNVNPGDEAVFALSQHFAELTAEQKKIEDEKAFLIRQMSLYGTQFPKLVSSSRASVASHDITHDDDVKFNETITVKESSPLTKQQQRLFNGFSKCAANFPQLPRKSTIPSAGIGRGMVMGSFENSNPRMRNEGIHYCPNRAHHPANKDETNPFLTAETSSLLNTSKQTYTISASNADDEDSVYYEDD